MPTHDLKKAEKRLGHHPLDNVTTKLIMFLAKMKVNTSATLKDPTEAKRVWDIIRNTKQTKRTEYDPIRGMVFNVAMGMDDRQHVWRSK
jgi:hypothetical protein